MRSFSASVQISCLRKALLAAFLPALAAFLLSNATAPRARAQPAAASPSEAFPSAQAGRFFAQNYASEEYGAHAQNWDIAHDANGLMYFANTNGVLVYDGVRWRLTSMPNESVTRSVAIGDRERIYVGAQNELGYLASDSLGQRRYTSLLARVPAKHRELTNVWKTFSTSEEIYFQSPEAIFHWSTGQDSMKVRVPETSFHLSFYVREELYVRERDTGLMRLRGDSLTIVPGGERFAEERIYTMLPYGKDQILVGTRSKGLYLYDGDRFTPFRTEATRYLLENQLYSGTRLPGGLFALATLRGGVVLMRPSGEVVRLLDKTVGLRNETAFSVHVGPQNGLWLGLNNGIARVDVPSPLSYYDETMGLRGLVHAVRRHQGRLYAATYQGVYRMSSSAGVGQPPMFEALPSINTRCWSLLSTKDGLLAGCTDGVFHIADGQPSRIADWTALTLHHSRQDAGRVLVGREKGLGVLQKRKDEWTAGGAPPLPLEGEIRSIAETSDGTLWLGTAYAGVYRVDFSNGFDASPVVRHFDEQEHGVPVGGVDAYSAADHITLATEQGLLRPTNDATAPFAPDSTFGAAFADGSRGVFRLAEDQRGNVWMNSAGEAVVARLQPDGSYDLRTLPERVSQMSGYALHPEPGGAVWLGGAEGLVRYDAPAREADSSPFPARVRRVSTAGSDSLIYGGAGRGAFAQPQLPYAHRALRFAYAAPDYGALSATQYQYRLEGFDADWSPWTGEVQKDYTNLPPGTYTFRTRARDTRGRRSQAGAFSFTILPPWYRTWWAYLLYGLMALGMVAGSGYGYNRWRTRRITYRNRQLERQVQQRTRSLREQKQTLERANRSLKQVSEQKNEFLGVAAHDLKNPLANILGSAELLLEENEEQPPDGFSDFAPEFISIIRSDAERMLDIIEQLLNAQVLESGKLELHRERVDPTELLQTVADWNREHADRKGITLDFEHDGATDPPSIYVDKAQMQRALDNFVSNAVKFSPGDSVVSLQIDGRRDDAVRLAVSDEGPGLTDEDKQKAFGKLQRLSAEPTGGESSTGLGLFAARAIVEQHGGSVGVNSTPGEGATFFIDLPYTEHRPALVTPDTTVHLPTDDQRGRKSAPESFRTRPSRRRDTCP